MAHGIILSSSQCPNTKAKLDKLKNVPYVSVVRSIMYAMDCTRLDLVSAMSMTSR